MNLEFKMHNDRQMKRIHYIIAIIFLSLRAAPPLNAAGGSDTTFVAHSDSVMINFHQSRWNLDKRLGDNAAHLDSIDSKLTKVFNDSVFRLRRVSVYGGASPEGTVRFNKFLSEHRAATLFGWFDRYAGTLGPIEKRFTYYGRDWEGVLALAEQDGGVPFRSETLGMLREIAAEKRAAGGEEPAGSLERLRNLRGGAPYRYLYVNIFPKVRASKVVIDYDRVFAPEIAELPAAAPMENPKLAITASPRVIVPAARPSVCKPFYMDIRTNMLFDALAVPNLGVEFYIGKDWSIGGGWMHAWWSHDPPHRYWRLYGGELNIRKWFGKAAAAKPLTGHHIGLYLQALTYDFEWGGKAHMGGMPGGNIYDLAHLGGGIEYGYSLPVKRRINIDFSIGLGYIGGKVHEFVPDGDRYLWTATKRKNWIGPTKIEVSLVWLIGCGNFNETKGGGK